jgi:hypothetical protein
VVLGLFCEMFSYDTLGMRKENKQVSEIQIFKDWQIVYYLKERFVHFHKQYTKVINYFLIKQPFDKKQTLHYFMISIILPIDNIIQFESSMVLRIQNI